MDDQMGPTSRNKAQLPVPKDEKELNAWFRQYLLDREFLEANRDELMRKYPEQCVVVFEEKVVEVARSHREAAANAYEKGIPTNRVVTAHLQANPPTLIV